MNITIKTIPHAEQRYETVGDWWFDKENIEIRVSDMGNWKYEALVGLHEAIEVLLCKGRGISQEAVDAFDKAYEAARGDDDSEPGDDPAAPYHREHQFAYKVEGMISYELDVDWEEYASAVVGVSS